MRRITRKTSRYCISEAITLTEEAWRLADKLDDPIAAGLTAIFGGVCCATLYDYRQAQAWYTRELDRARSRLVVSLRQPLCDLLASALVSQGDAEGGSTAAGPISRGVPARMSPSCRSTRAHREVH